MKRLFALAVTLALLSAIFLSVDRAELAANFRAMKWAQFAAAMLLFIPQNFLIVWRWRMLARNFTPLGWAEAARLILAAQTMNIVLPSKMGDLTKAWFLHRTGALDLPRATSLVVFEKMLDLASLSLLAVLGVIAAHVLGVEAIDPAKFGALSAAAAGIGGFVVMVTAALYFVPPGRLPFYAGMMNWLARTEGLRKVHGLAERSREVLAMLQRPEARRWRIVGLSLLLWGLHLAQIYFFFLSLNAGVPAAAFVSLMPLAIFVGLLPLSLFGMGTRDAAIIFLFAPWRSAAVLAGVGLFVSLRYIVPSIAGLPYLHRYLAMKPEQGYPTLSGSHK